VTWDEYFQYQIGLLHESGMYRRIRWTERRRVMFYALCALHFMLEKFKEVV
jgi:hypothetical protein